MKAEWKKQSVPFFEQNGLSDHIISIYIKSESHWKKKNLNKKTTKKAKPKSKY